MHYERLKDVLSKMRRASHKVRCVYDIGANSGAWTESWKKTYPDAAFVMFEANPSHHMPLWMKPNDVWINTVLSKPGVDEVDFYRMPNTLQRGTGDSYYVENTHHYKDAVITKLKATTLDAVIQKKQLPLPQLVKMDTQGSEVDILQGAQETFKTVDVCVCEMPIVEYNKGAPSFSTYLSTFQDMGFTPAGIDQDHVSHGKLIQIDMVFVKNEHMHLLQ